MPSVCTFCLLTLVAAAPFEERAVVVSPASVSVTAPSSAPVVAPSPATPLKLAPRKLERPTESTRAAASRGEMPVATMAGSLAAVLLLFFFCAWMLRKTGRGMQPLPKDVVEVLGRLPFQGREQLQLVRVGRKLLLVSVSPSGTETLTEISDPDEVQRLIELCQRGKPGSVSAGFRQVLAEIGHEPARGDFWGRADAEVR